VSRRRGPAALTGSPVLVGAVTVLVTIVAVFLSYNANSGLPFVPTYDLKANVPNAAQLVKGFEVRIGGARVGIVSRIVPKRHPDGSTYAQLTLKLDKDVEPLPKDTTLLVRPRSTLGLKYLQLSPGRSSQGFQAGATIPVRQARPQNVELDEFLNMFDDAARSGSQRNLQGFGNGLAGRGQDLNSAIPALVPLLHDLEPVARNLGSPRTQLGRFFRSLARAAGEVAPVAETQASLFVNLDVTFTALASIARPYLQETISEAPLSEAVAIRDFPRQRPFLRNNAALFRELAPGVATLPSAAPLLADAFIAGARVLPKTEQLNAGTADVLESLRDFSNDQLAEQGIDQLTRLTASLKPTLSFLTPTQTVCNYVTLWFRNVASLLSEGDANGTYQRFIIIDIPEGPNGEGGPSSAPANGPTSANHLHSNPYPNTAAPGQPRECEAGNERYAIGRTVVGNPPGNQGTLTSGQKGAKGAGASP
jgi:virulence factor Mce-like protein